MYNFIYKVCDTRGINVNDLNMKVGELSTLKESIPIERCCLGGYLVALGE